MGLPVTAPDTRPRPGDVLRQEIGQQSAVVAGILRAATQRDLAGVLDRPNVLLTGRGSSGAAALYGAAALTLFGKRLAHDVSPSLLGFYRPELDLRETVLLAISQSGSSREVLEAASWARARGAKVVALTNCADSPLTAGLPPEQVLLMGAGPEHAVPATKTFTASLAWLLALAMAPRLESLLRLPERMRKRVKRDYTTDIDSLADVNAFYFVGEGVAASVAREGALKFRETLGVAAIALETSDLLHGSIAALDDHSVVIGLAADPVGASVLAQARGAWEARGARCLCFSAGDDPDDEAALGDALHASFPLLAVLPLQLISLGLAIKAGRDADRPAGLVKVTETAVPRRRLGK